MTINEATRLRERIRELEHEMMEFRTSMARVLSELYASVHELENWQQWNTAHDKAVIEQLNLMRDCVTEHFNMSELRTMCFDMGINFDDLEGDGLNNKARELVLLLNRTNRCAELVQYCERLRPGVMLRRSQG